MMDAPVSSPLIHQNRRLSSNTEDAILYAVLIVVAVIVIVAVGAIWLGIDALAVQPGNDAWLNWWGSIWKPIVTVILGIIIDLVLLVLLASKAYDD
jgi:biotin transporter BioY